MIIRRESSDKAADRTVGWTRRSQGYANVYTFTRGMSTRSRGDVDDFGVINTEPSLVGIAQRALDVAHAVDVRIDVQM